MRAELTRVKAGAAVVTVAIAVAIIAVACGGDFTITGIGAGVSHNCTIGFSGP
jgi:hypothetical protein